MVDSKGSMFRLLTTCLTITALTACQTTAMKKETVSTYAFRLKPGEDLKEGIEKQVMENQINAGWITTCTGSLTEYMLRFANQPEDSSGSGHFEIVSLVDTVSTNGSHIHISISDSTGKTIGGHLMPGLRSIQLQKLYYKQPINMNLQEKKMAAPPGKSCR
jgi:uncharacterized protein